MHLSMILLHFLYYFRDNTAKLWNVSTGQCLRTITHTVDVRSVFFNSYAIFTGDEYTDLFMWDFAKCADSKVPDTKSNEGYLLRTLTGRDSFRSEQGTFFNRKNVQLANFFTPSL